MAAKVRSQFGRNKKKANYFTAYIFDCKSFKATPEAFTELNRTHGDPLHHQNKSLPVNDVTVFKRGFKGSSYVPFSVFCGRVKNHLFPSEVS
jgi:hypothetical protein